MPCDITRSLGMIACITSLIYVNAASQVLDKGRQRHYCEWESFHATCEADEVVVIRSAKYGRMAIGRCVTKSYGQLGCSADVTPDFDRQCSGRQNCTVPVISLHTRRSCPQDFKSYLEAGYDCVKVWVPAVEACRDRHSAVLLSSPSGTIASRLVNQTACPWRISVQPYQRINITLVDFSVPPNAGPTSSRSPDDPHSVSARTQCDAYATISETGEATPSRNRLQTTVCGGTMREHSVYTSSSNVVDIEMTSLPEPKYFMLKYQAFGCPPIIAPEGASVHATSEHARVKCNATDEAWYLTCVGTHWVGSVTNCSSHGRDGAGREEIGRVSDFPFGILIVVALGVAIGVAIGVVMLVGVLAYMKRRRQRKVRSRSNYILKHVPECSDEAIKTPATECSMTTDCTPMLIKRDPGDDVSLCNSTPCSRRQLVHSWPRNRPLPHPALTGQDGGSGEMEPDGVLLVPETHPQTPSRGDLQEFSTLPLREPLVASCNNMSGNGTIYSVTPCSAGGPHTGVFSTFKPVRGSNATATPSRRPKSYYVDANGRRLEDAPYYFKFEGSTGSGCDGHNHKPDVVQQGCRLCQANANAAAAAANVLNSDS